MLQLTFNHQENSFLRTVLCLGAHSDDIEIGCGGTVLKLIKNFPNLSFYWVVFGATGKRQEEAVASAESFLQGAGSTKIIIQEFRDGFFPYMGASIKESFEQLKKEVSPDLIFTHYRNDLHQDHQLISNLTRNTFRDHLILEYEIPKYDGDLGSPNTYVHINDSTRQRKIDLLMKHFATQSNKQWFTEETFSSIMRIRGIESNSVGRYSEAFYCYKAVLL